MTGRGAISTPVADRLADLSRRLGDGVSAQEILDPIFREIERRTRFSHLVLYRRLPPLTDLAVVAALPPQQAGVSAPAGRHPAARLSRGEMSCYHVRAAVEERDHLPDGCLAAAGLPIFAEGQIAGVLWGEQRLSEAEIDPQPLGVFREYSVLCLLALLPGSRCNGQSPMDALSYPVAAAVIRTATAGALTLIQRNEADQLCSLTQNRIPVNEPADVKAVRDQARSAAAAAGLNETRTDDFALCASEAATNALMHAGGGWAAFETKRGQARVCLRDNGSGIALSNLLRATLVPGWSGGRSLGMGFIIIIRCANRITLCTDEKGTMLLIEVTQQPSHGTTLQVDDLDSLPIDLGDD